MLLPFLQSPKTTKTPAATKQRPSILPYVLALIGAAIAAAAYFH